MQINKFIDYSFRTLIYLGSSSNPTSTIKDISSSFNISQNHLVKVVHNLSNAGLIDSARGKNGGIKLAKGIGEIGLGDILKIISPPESSLECHTQNSNCVIDSGCKLKQIFASATDNYYEKLNEHNLNHVLLNTPYLRKILDN